MRRKVGIFAALLALAGLAMGFLPGLVGPSLSTALGQASLVHDWRSGIKVQNLSDRVGTVTLEFVDEEGDTVGGEVTQQLPGLGSVEFYLTTLPIPDGRFSAVVLADVPIAAVATQTDYGDGVADSYNASSGAQEVGVPYVYRGINDWYTTVFVQNAGTETATVWLRVAAPGVDPVLVSASVPPKATKAFETSTDAFDALGSDFRGSGVVNSTEGVELAVTAFHIRVGGTVHVMTSMKGSDAANTGTTVALPSLYRLLNNWRSGIQVLNPSATETVDVTLTFRPDHGYMSGGPWTKSGITLGPREDYEFYLTVHAVDGGSLLPDAFRGSAMVSATGPVQVNVIHTRYERDVAMGYAGIDVDSASSRLSFPSLYGDFGYGPWNSGIKVQNLSGSASATVDFTFRADEGILEGGTWRRTGVELPPMGSFEYYLSATPLDGGGPLPSGFRGSATVEVVEGSAAIVGTAIHTNYWRHVANMYTGISY